MNHSRRAQHAGEDRQAMIEANSLHDLFSLPRGDPGVLVRLVRGGLLEPCRGLIERPAGQADLARQATDARSGAGRSPGLHGRENSVRMLVAEHGKAMFQRLSSQNLPEDDDNAPP